MPVRYIGDIGEIIDDLAQEFQQGKVKALAVVYLDEKNIVNFSWAGFKSYMEQVGAAVMMQETMFKECQESAPNQKGAI